MPTCVGCSQAIDVSVAYCPRCGTPNPEAHEAARALGQAVRALLPPERAFGVPPALPPTPPTIGGQ